MRRPLRGGSDHPRSAVSMVVQCFDVVRMLAARAHRHFGHRVHRLSGHVLHRAPLRILFGSAVRRPVTVSAKVCIATGLAGLGMAGIVAGGVTFGATTTSTPGNLPDPSVTSGPSAAGGAADPAISRDPGEGIIPAGQTIPFDPDATIGLADPAVTFDPSGPDGWPNPPTPFDPGAVGDPPDPETPPDPRTPPVSVPEPSSLAVLGVGLLIVATRIGHGLGRIPHPILGRDRRQSGWQSVRRASALTLASERRRGAGDR
jgi:hypothetical protein